MITKAEFLDWKTQAVTLAIMDEIKAQIQAKADWLASQAGIDPTSDRFIAGEIAGLRSLLAIEAAEVSVDL